MTCLAKSEERMKYSVLAIEYIGESDKPVTPVVISDSKAGAEWYRRAVLKRSESELTDVHVIRASLLEKLVADVDASKGAVQQEGRKNLAPSKTVRVSITMSKRSLTLLYDTGSAISLLESLQKSCGNEESLRSDLAHFQDRIRAFK